MSDQRVAIARRRRRVVTSLPLLCLMRCKIAQGWPKVRAGRAFTFNRAFHLRKTPLYRGGDKGDVPVLSLVDSSAKAWPSGRSRLNVASVCLGLLVLTLCPVDGQGLVASGPAEQPP